MSERAMNGKVDYIRRLELENMRLRGQTKVVPELLEVCKQIMHRWLKDEGHTNDDDARLVRAARVDIETTEKTLT